MSSAAGEGIQQIVIDASCAIAFVGETEPYHEQARSLIARLGTDKVQLIAPPFSKVKPIPPFSGMSFSASSRPKPGVPRWSYWTRWA